MDKREKRVMIVDDDEEFLNEMDETLSMAGYRTDLFSNGLAALEMFRRIKPDVVLLDLKMDGKNGFQTAREMRNMPEGQEVHIIAMTGHYTNADHRRLMEACRIDDIMLKPIKPLNTIAKIEELLG